MNVKDAIKKVERQQEKARETAEKYLKKGQEMAYLAVECEADQKSKHEMWRAEAKEIVVIRNMQWHLTMQKNWKR